MEADPRTAIAFQWDSRDIDKLAKRQIRPEDVEAVFTNRSRRFLRNKRSGTTTYLMVGTDDSGEVAHHRRAVGRRTRTGAPCRDGMADMSDHMNPTEEETHVARIEADASDPDLDVQVSPSGDVTVEQRAS
jgi:hypothetical protein